MIIPHRPWRNRPGALYYAVALWNKTNRRAAKPWLWFSYWSGTLDRVGTSDNSTGAWVFLTIASARHDACLYNKIDGKHSPYYAEAVVVINGLPWRLDFAPAEGYSTQPSGGRLLR